MQERLKMPVLWDHNALALHGIDPAKIEVKLPAKKLTYSLILQARVVAGQIAPRDPRRRGRQALPLDHHDQAELKPGVEGRD